MKLLAVLFAVAANPILFVTQVPVDGDFTTVTSTFGNHRSPVDSAPRGGDLWIRYPDGSLKNLTRAAGFGNDGRQGASSIAVREPSVHWSGTKALFSMVIGAPLEQYRYRDGDYWQIYELTGLGKTDTPTIRKIANQPASYNNVSPIYASDDRILFTSDRPRNGARHLYPQLDEYEEAPTVTGLWSLNELTGELRILNHAPSGVFSPSIDSFGRVIFTRWDHLQRDQQADTDVLDGTNVYGTFDYADESENAARMATRTEVFPEPRSARTDLLAGTNLEGLSINHFFPWEMNEDGTSEETLNHIGRHELHRYFNRSLNDDNALREFAREGNTILNMFQIREDPAKPGRYVGNDAPEFGTFGSGRIVAIQAEPGRNPDEMRVEFLTPNGNDTYRDPLPLANGELVFVHDFRLKFADGTPLTTGLAADVSWWTPDVLATFKGTQWELQPVEVRPRPRPPLRATPLEEPEARVFREEKVDPEAFRADLRRRGLAAVVTRDVTRRDRADTQQPYNLHLPGKPAPLAGKSYEVAHMQFFSAQQVRGVNAPGRRVLARDAGTVAVAADGSVAALVPASRALSWQTTDSAKTPVVRERYWITLQPGEVRVCNSCHGVNTRDQVGQQASQQAPEALRKLLREWKKTPSKRRAAR
ncbi:MAG TPA: hypothetical protein VNI54_07675 [Thermoanaerobaculia bacterium]|nr:hypothetical protein [Thermoanaerobaculia bacterium]